MTRLFDHCLWGAAIGGRGASDATQYGATTVTGRQADLEALYGRPYDIIRVYDIWSGIQINTARNQGIVSAGKKLWLSVKADSAVTGINPSWPQISSGTRNAEIQAHADAVKAIYNTAGVNNADQVLVFTFHHEPQGDNTRVAADFIAAYTQYRAVFLDRLSSATGGAAFLGTVYFGPVFFGLSYHDGSIDSWWPGDAVCDFAGADCYNTYPATGGPSSYTEFSNGQRAGNLKDFAIAHAKPAFIGEVGTLEAAPVAFNPLLARNAANRYDSTTTSPQNVGGHAGEGPPYDRWPPDASVIARDPDGSVGTKSKAAWIDHLRIFISDSKFADGNFVFQVLCWFDQTGVYNRMTNSSDEAISAMQVAAAAPVFTPTTPADITIPIIDADVPPPHQLPLISWALNGRSIVLQGFDMNDNKGGYDQLRGSIPETDWYASRATQGSVITAYDDQMQPAWEGRISSEPQIVAGLAKVAAQGEKYRAVKKTNRLFIQTRDVTQWVTSDSEPLTGGQHNKHFDTHIDGGRAIWLIDGGTALNVDDKNGIFLWIDEVDLQRVAFEMNYSDPDNDLEFQVVRVDGPTIGSPTNVTTGGAPYACTSGNNGVDKDTGLFANPNNAIGIYLRCKNAETLAAGNPGKERFWLRELRANSSITASDNYDVYKILKYIGGVLNWEVSHVVSSNFNALPFDWTEDWASAADYLSDLEDRFWRVGARALGDTQPKLESDLWEFAKNWPVYLARGTEIDLVPLERYDAVVVTYKSPSGVVRTKRVKSTTVDVGGNEFPVELQDAQKDNTFATAIANRLLPRVSSLRYSGSITSPDLWGSRYGDTVTIQDWGPGKNLQLRIDDVAMSGDDAGTNAPVVTVDQPIPVEAIMARRHRHHRH